MSRGEIPGAGVWMIALLGFFVLSFSACAGRRPHPPPLWEQLYEPIEEVAPLAYARQALLRAEELYGPAAFPITEIHLRRSVAKKELALLSRADILDWSRLAHLVQGAHPLIGEGLREESRLFLRAVAEGGEVERAGQVAVLADLNRLLLAASSVEVQRRRWDRELAGIIQPLPDAARDLPAGLELCAELPGRPGHYVLWLSAPAEAEEFPAQLGHETFHLLNNRLYDWYVEGLASLFSEAEAERQGLSWQGTREYFRARRESDPYALAYWLMRELQAAAGAGMRTFLAHAVWTDPERTRMHIDINGWLASLPPEAARAARAIITSQAQQMLALAGGGNHFAVPGAER